MSDELKEKLSIHMVAHALTTYLDASPDMQSGIADMVRVITSETAGEDDREIARNTLAEWLWPSEAVEAGMVEMGFEPATPEPTMGKMG